MHHTSQTVALLFHNMFCAHIAQNVMELKVGANVVHCITPYY